VVRIQSLQQSTNIAKLPCAEGAAHNDWLRQHEDHCLQDIRVELRKQITDWCDDPNSKCIFWLNGMAGTGKSTISRTIARELAERRRLAASFFFTRGKKDISHSRMFFTTIAAQIANSLPVLRTFISDAIDSNPDIFKHGLREQWNQLILNPLKNAPTQSIQLVVVIDALDECDSMQDIQLILLLLEEAKDLATVRIKIFLTSRPEIPIFDGFRQLSGEAYQDFILHNIPLDTVNADISTFFVQKLSPLKAKHGLGTPWPDERVVEQLVERAAGLFIYAATTLRFIQDGIDGPEEQLSLILSATKSSLSATEHLDGIYTTLLQHSVLGKRGSQECEQLAGRFRQVVGSIVVMFNTMPARNLAQLLQIPFKRVSGTLDSLRSVLDVPENESQPIRLFHLSFRDFLQDSQRCTDSRFHIHEKERHTSLFRKCMSHISQLKENICGLWGPGVLITEIPNDTIQKSIPPHVQYACRYWLEHWRLGNPVEEDIKTIRQFLQQYLLHWLEGLSLIGEVSNGAQMIIALEEILSVSYNAY